MRSICLDSLCTYLIPSQVLKKSTVAKKSSTASLVRVPPSLAGQCVKCFSVLPCRPRMSCSRLLRGQGHGLLTSDDWLNGEGFLEFLRFFPLVSESAPRWAPLVTVLCVSVSSWVDSCSTFRVRALRWGASRNLLVPYRSSRWTVLVRIRLGWLGKVQFRCNAMGKTQFYSINK
jgi:hypothetical protein